MSENARPYFLSLCKNNRRRSSRTEKLQNSFDSTLSPKILNSLKKKKIVVTERIVWEFLGGPVVRTQRFHCQGHKFNPWLGN